MKLFKKINLVINNPYIVLAKMIKGRAKFLSDKIYLKIMYHANFGKKLDLQNPVTFNEKLQWLKINDRKLEYKEIVDKYAVRNIVKSEIGEEYLTKLYGIWNSFDEIDFDNLPDKFVLKCTHDSGSVVICNDKSKFDIEYAKNILNRGMKKDHFWVSREWPYKNIKPRIIAEEYLQSENLEPIKDYKFFCFNGEPKYMYIASDRSLGKENLKCDYFDIKFNRLNLSQPGAKNSEYKFNKPKQFDKMIYICEKLSKDYPQIRIDLYEVNNKVYFGEYTLYHHGGMVAFNPEEYDVILGDLINISNING